MSRKSTAKILKKLDKEISRLADSKKKNRDSDYIYKFSQLIDTRSRLIQSDCNDNGGQ